MSVSCQSDTGLPGAESLTDFSLGTDCLRGANNAPGQGDMGALGGKRWKETRERERGPTKLYFTCTMI